jgi:hypothetical protein
MFYLKPPRHISTLPKGEILAASKCFPLFFQERTFDGPSDVRQRFSGLPASRQSMLKAYFFTRTIPACVTVDAVGRVDPSVSGSSSPSALRVNC